MQMYVARSAEYIGIYESIVIEFLLRLKIHRIGTSQDVIYSKCDMNGVLGTYRLTGPGEPPEDGEMKEMTLPSRHMIRNSSPGGLWPSTLLLVTEDLHNIESSRVSGK